MTLSVYLSILGIFFRATFYRASPGNCLFHVQEAGFQSAYAVKNYFTCEIKHFAQERNVAIRRRSFTRKHLCYSFVFNEAADLQSIILSKKDSSTDVFL